jgi:5-(aminomethyl)-3-furanmethanol phosphate kinase
MSDSSVSTTDVTIIKLGGSLMSLPDLNERLHSLLKRVSGQCLIVPGGGAAADEIRELDRLVSLSAMQSHWWAIEAMSFNADVLSRLLGRDFAVSASREDAESVRHKSRFSILDPTRFLVAEEQRTVVPKECLSASILPASWDVTSDSIAAWIAHRWPTKRLVMVKSCDRPLGSIWDWSKAGAVDPCFPQIAQGLSIDWVNLLRDAEDSLSLHR